MPRLFPTHLATCRPAMTLAELTLVMSVLGIMLAVAVPVMERCCVDGARTVTGASLKQVRETVVGSYYNHAFESLPYPLDPARVKHPQLAYLYVNPHFRSIGTSVSDSYWSGTPIWPASWSNATIAFLPRSTADVLYDPVTRRGWSGPYLMSTMGTYQIAPARGFSDLYGQNGDPAPLDGWGNPIVLQQPVLLSASVASYSDLTYARLVSAGPNGILETPATVLSPTLAERGDDVILSLGAPQ